MDSVKIAKRADEKRIAEFIGNPEKTDDCACKI